MRKNFLLNRIKELSSPIYPEKVEHNTKLDPLSGIKCVAFDFYGTMFISTAGDIGIDENRHERNTRFFEEALNACNLTILEENTALKGIRTFNQVVESHTNEMKKQDIDYPEPDVRNIIYETLIKLHRQKLIEGNITNQAVNRCVIEFEFRSNAIWPLPNLLTHLENLKKCGLTLGIISNSQFYSPLSFEAITSVTVDDFGFVPELQKWSYLYGIKKPSHAFYKLFTDELINFSLKPEEVLYVGNDLFKDVIPAKKQGMKTALFVGDTRSIRHKPEDLNDNNMPDMIIDDLAQIEECV